MFLHRQKEQTGSQNPQSLCGSPGCLNMICVLKLNHNLVIKLLFLGPQNFLSRVAKQRRPPPNSLSCNKYSYLVFSWNGLNSQWIWDAMSTQAWKKFALKKKSSAEAQQAMRNQVIIDFSPPSPHKGNRRDVFSKQRDIMWLMRTCLTSISLKVFRNCPKMWSQNFLWDR